MTTSKQRANAPVVKKSDLSDDVLAKFKGKSFDDTAALREQNVERSKRALRNVVDGKTIKPHALWSDDEHAGQSLFFSVEKPKLIAKYPDVANIMGLPLFQTGKKGKAGALSGARANAEGRRKGTFDICYPVARGVWHSLWLESKIDAKIADEQREFQRDMIGAGNLALFVRGGDAKSLALELSIVVDMYERSGPFQSPSRSLGQDDCVYQLLQLLSCQIR